jgi:hypothetical protein
MKTQQFNNQGSNRFVSKSSLNDTKIKTKIETYNYRENDFPDLANTGSKVIVESKNNNKDKDNNYASITATVVAKNNIIDNTIKVPPGWTMYKRNENNFGFTVSHGEKTQSQILQEQKEKLETDPEFIHNNMIETLVNNWSRYKYKYDEIHGEGSYDLVYYTEPIYSLDELYSDIESDNDSLNYSSYDEFSS